MKNNDDATRPTPRNTCKTGRVVRSTLPPGRNTMAGSMMSTNTEKRIQAISIGGSSLVRYFDIASEQARNTVEAMTSEMPRNGRSVRCGARARSRIGEYPESLANAGTGVGDGGKTVPGIWFGGDCSTKRYSRHRDK